MRKTQARGQAKSHRPIDEIPFLAGVIVCEWDNDGRIMVGSLELGEILRVTNPTLKILVI